MTSNLSAKRLYRNAVDGFFRRQVRYQFELIDYSIPLVPAQLANLALNALHLAVPGMPVVSLPPVIQVEPASTCTLRCPLCPTGAGQLGRAATLLDFDLYRRMMDDIGRYLLLMQFWGWGEPFVNPRACDMIRLAKERDVVVVTSTNGQHLDSEVAARRLVESGLDTLIVAIDGTRQATYEKYRIRGRIDRLLQGVARVLELRERLGLDRPLVNFQLTVMRHNEHEIEEMRALASRLAVDFLTLRTVAPLTDPAGLYPSFVPGGDRYRHYGSADHDPAQVPGKDFRCMRPFSKAMLFADGTLVPCEVDHAAAELFGRLSESAGFREVWFSPSARAFRKAFAKDKDLFPLCRTCHFKIRMQDDCVVEGVPCNARTMGRLGGDTPTSGSP